MRQGVSVTFMAKFASGQAGSSCHIHFSLWRDGKNAFPGEKRLGPVECSDAFRWFLGGWIAHVPDLMVFYAPTINSYKRYVDALVGADPPRMELRQSHGRLPRRWQRQRACASNAAFPAPTAIPISRFAAALASGLDGIAQPFEPPEHFSGDVYAARNLPRVPYTLAEAADVFAIERFREAGVRRRRGRALPAFLPDRAAAYDLAVTDWERRRYFERI